MKLAGIISLIFDTSVSLDDDDVRTVRRLTSSVHRGGVTVAVCGLASTDGRMDGRTDVPILMTAPIKPRSADAPPGRPASAAGSAPAPPTRRWNAPRHRGPNRYRDSKFNERAAAAMANDRTVITDSRRYGSCSIRWAANSSLNDQTFLHFYRAMLYIHAFRGTSLR